MAYGQTGSGKTHTMLGASDKSEVGLLNLTPFRYLFLALHAFHCPPFAALLIRGLSTRAMVGASDKAGCRALPHL